MRRRSRSWPEVDEDEWECIVGYYSAREPQFYGIKEAVEEMTILQLSWLFFLVYIMYLVMYHVNSL